MRELDLTDAQREKIEGIVEARQEKVDAARRTLAKAHKTLAKATQGDANEAAIRGAAAALGTAIGDEAVLRVAILKEIKAVLTAEQLAQLETLKGKMKGRGPGGSRPQGEDRPPLPPPDQDQPQQ
jgi:Spy/CpxP family protein refolding chaperone